MDHAPGGACHAWYVMHAMGAWRWQDVGIGSAVAAFLISMGPYSYFQTSSSASRKEA